MTVRSVGSPADLRTFIGFPYRHYRSDPLWVPPLRRDVSTLLSRTENPFFEHGEAACFQAERGDSMRNALERMGFVVYKTYRLYDRPL